MPQKLDFQPIDFQAEPLDFQLDFQPEDDPSLMERWESSVINQPLSRHIKYNDTQLFDPKEAANYYDPANLDPTKQARIPDWIPFVGGGTWRSLGAGSLEGAGNVVEGLTTPLNLATMGAFSGAGALSRIAPGTAQALNTAGRVLSAPVAATGAAKVLDSDRPLSERAFGVAELAGGIAGVKQKLPGIKPGVSQAAIPEAPIDPNFNQGMGDPMLAGSTPYPQGQPLPHTVSLKNWTPIEVEKYKKLGYESGGVNEKGYAQMVRKDLIEKTAQTEKKAQAAVEPSIFGPDEIAFDEEIAVKRPSAPVIKKLKEQGYEFYDVAEDGITAIFRPISEQEMRVPNQPEGTADIPNEFLPDLPYQEKRLSDVGPPMGMMDRRLPERYDDPTLMDKMRPSDKQIPNARQDQLLGILGGKQGLKNIEPGSMMPEPDLFTPQEMKVKGVREGEGGLENVAVGGADPRVLDVLGSSLYTKPRPVVTMKELLQNAIDEHRISKTKSPIRVLVRDHVKNPLTGEESNAITVRDRGRGLTPEEIYTVFTDVGKTGKAGIESASGGFGFAKAAPFLGGKYVQVESVVLNEAGQKVKYTFQGDPAMLKNQVRGVPLNREVVDPNTPTGLQVTTHFPKDTGTYSAEEIAKNMATMAGKGGPEMWLASNSSGSGLEPGTTHYSYLNDPLDDFDKISSQLYVNRYKGQGLPKIQGQIETPGAKIDIRYDNPRAGQEAAGYDIHYMNKGLYQQSGYGAYGNEPYPNVPRSIVADITAIVEEGTEGYPFGANREQVDRSVSSAIEQWIDENIKSGARRKQVTAIQEKYDNIKTLPGSKSLYYDKGEKFTPDELELITTHPEFKRGVEVIEMANQELLSIADTLNWTQGGNPNADWVPSKRLKKFGVLFQGPEGGSTTLGIHIPRPDDLNDSAILINVMELLNMAMRSKNPLNNLSTSLYATLTHELAHIPGGGHDTGFAYRHAQLMEQLGRQNTVHILDNLYDAFNDGSGNISPDVSDLLSIYNDSRARKTSKSDSLLSTGVSSERPSNIIGRKGSDVEGAGTGENQPSALTEAYNLSRGLLASWDVSAPFRQGHSLMFSKEFRDSIGPMMKSLGPEEFYNAVRDSIESKPIFQKRVNTKTGKILPSFAEQAGLKLTDLRKSLSNREEATMSNWAEKYVPGVQRSNRAYNTFLNKLRADTFEKLVNQARDMAVEAEKTGSARQGLFREKFTPEQAQQLNPYRNMELAKEIADFVMTATGRGPLKIATPTLAKKADGSHYFAMKDRSFEQAADILTNTLFSPRLFTSRIRMLNPGTYVMASPFVRKQYLKAFLTSASAWGMMSGLAALAGAEVSGDTNSSDFGKIKVGNTRLDPAGGYQQYLVAASRLMSGQTTSSATGVEQTLGE